MKAFASAHRVNAKYSFEQKEEVRLDFVTGKGSLKWCSQKHKISYQTICRWASREEWSLQREDWFREKKLRGMVPMLQAMINPPNGGGVIAAAQPLSPEFFAAHNQLHHANLDKMHALIRKNWDILLGEDKDQTSMTMADRSALMRETRELITLQRTLLGIPNVAPIRRPHEPDKKGRRSGMGDLDLSSLKVANAKEEMPVERPKAKVQDTTQPVRYGPEEEEHEVRVRPVQRRPLVKKAVD